MVGLNESRAAWVTNDRTATADLATAADRPERRTIRRRRMTLVTAAIAAIAVDALSKMWASARLSGEPISLGPLTLRLVHNRGVAFGVGGFLPAGTIIIVTALIAVVVAVVGWRGRLDPPAAAGLIVGGALANVGDRLTAGSVVDFIDIGRWPVFNLADVVLLTGIALMIRAGRTSTPASVEQPAQPAAGSRGRPDASQAVKPPSSSTMSLKPSASRSSTAAADRLPDRQ